MSNWTMIGHLTDALNRKQLGSPKLPTLWPSEASAIITNEYDEKVVVGRCRRSTFFRFLIASYLWDPNSYKDYEELVKFLTANELPPDQYLKWIWAMGELYEEYMVTKAKDSGLYWASQVPLYIKEHNVSGKIDLVILQPQSHQIAKTEIKSVYGHNSDAVIGSFGKKNKSFGTPKDSNLMQIALYDSHPIESDVPFGPSLLIYGARDTGRFAEYKVQTNKDEQGIVKIAYKQLAPYEGKTVISPITLNSIFTDGFDYVTKSLADRYIPPRDFDIQYSEEQIAIRYSRGELNKADTERFEKRKAIDEENAKREQEGEKLKKQILPIEDGDWQCRLCSFKRICYNEDNSPREI